MTTLLPTEPGASQPGYRYRFSIAACGRWEEQDVIEWVEYHRSVGFDHIYFYSNDEDPMPTFRVLLPYVVGPAPFVTFRHVPKRNPRVPQQPEIYFHFLRTLLHETEWFALIDIDEFFVFKNCNNVHAFMAPFEQDYDSVYFNWLIHGHNHKPARTPDSILLTHTLRADHIDPHTKTITRSARIQEPHIRERHGQGAGSFWHFWNRYDIPDFQITNVLGDRIEDYADDFPRRAVDYVRGPGKSAAMIANAYIAHFQFKSEADFVRRVARGGSHTVALWQKTIDDGTYRQRLVSGNAVWDTYLAAYWLSHVGPAFTFGTETPVPVPGHPNLALRKPTRQSSIRLPGDSEPVHSAVQGHANDGIHTGTFGFCTRQETAPWWMVDLLECHLIEEIHIYNRMDAPGCGDRARHLVIAISDDLDDWHEIFRTDPESEVFGGIGTKPLIVRLPAPSAGRYVRISSAVPTTLHLDEIEIFGALGNS